jgi:hypothetical protein
LIQEPRQNKSNKMMRWISFVIRALLRATKASWKFARRWPAAAMIIAAALVILWPLCVDLFFAIPPRVRNAGGWCIVAVLHAAGVNRIWRIEPEDDAVPADSYPAFHWTSLVPALVCVAMAVPYLRGPRNLGYGDWDLNLAKYEAVRRTVLEWGQFPWWDPWCRGGFPLAANPQCGVVGIATPLVLALGTSVGMRLAQLGCLLIAMEGTRRLALLWFGEPLAAAAAGLIYGINGAVLSQAMCGYHLPMSYCSFSWILYFVFRLDRRRWDGFWLGFWLAFNVLNGINYYNVYAMVIVAIVWLRGIRARSGAARSRFLLHTVLAVSVLLTLAGWRLTTTGLVIRDFPRPYRSWFDLSPWSVLMCLITRPKPVDMLSMKVPEYWNLLWYVGPVVLALAALSLGRGWRWWHTLTAGCIWLAAGSVAWYHPSSWLSYFPLFSSMHVVSRWRIMAMLGFALAAADVLARWRRSGLTVLHRLALFALIVIAVDYGLLGCQTLHLGFGVEPNESEFPGAPTDSLVQVRDGSGFAAIQRGFGVICTQEPLLGYDFTAPTARRFRELPEYNGEFWTAAGPVRPSSWSPNRMTFQVEPGQTVFINQNPGSWWLVNGRQAYPEWRCTETEREFAVSAEGNGRLELQIHPRGLELGLALHVTGFALFVLLLVAFRLPVFRQAAVRHPRDDA